jgi:hypothetical protein
MICMSARVWRWIGPMTIKDLREFREAMAKGHWDDGRARLDRAIANMEFVADNASIGEHERETLREDIRSLRDVRDGWR